SRVPCGMYTAVPIASLIEQHEVFAAVNNENGAGDPIAIFLNNARCSQLSTMKAVQHTMDVWMSS
ncbi:5780_t:CDS:2, partial [Gigaspora rosea]